MFWKHDPTLIVRARVKKSDDARVRYRVLTIVTYKNIQALHILSMLTLRVGNYTAGNLYMALYLLICGEAANLRFISQSASAPFLSSFAVEACKPV